MRVRLVILSCLLLAGCGLVAATAPTESPDVEGRVIHLLPDQRALIEATFRAGTYPDTFYVVPGADILVREPDGTVRRGDRNDIRVGDHLRAWLTGIELRSYPPQYPARTVEVHRAAP